MHTTELLDRLKANGVNESEMCRKYGIDRRTISQARTKQHASPALATILATELGEHPGKWAIQAAAENERSAGMRRHLEALARTLST